MCNDKTMCKMEELNQIDRIMIKMRQVEHSLRIKCACAGPLCGLKKQCIKPKKM